MEEKLLELLKSILLRLEQLEGKLHEHNCADDSRKIKFIEELEVKINLFKEESVHIFTAKQLYEKSLVINQSKIYKVFENALVNIEARFEDIIKGEGLKLIDGNYKSISTKIKDDFQSIETKLDTIERRMNKVKNPYNIFLFSLAMLIISFVLVGFLSVNIGDTARDLNRLEQMNLQQYQLGNLATYFKENPEKYKSYKKWQEEVKQQSKKKN